MINAHISGNGFGQTGGFLGAVKRFIAIFAALGVGALMIAAAGIVAITTAIIGVIVAFVAMLFRFGAFKRASASMSERGPSNTTASNSPDVLDAKPTARGWTVDR